MVKHLSRQLRFSYGEITYKGRTATLTRRQYDILKAIVEAGEITPERLFERVYEDEFYSSTRSLLRVHVAAIRRKLKAAGIPVVIQARRGFGYRALLR